MAGAAIAAIPAPLIRPLFHPPTGGVGAVTVAAYPKSWDYAVIALLVLGAFVGGVVASGDRRPTPAAVSPREVARRSTWLAAAIVFLLMLFVHDHPDAFMDPFHEGEHLTAGWLLKSGAHPYRDFFVFHGLATDAGLDALVLGEPPSPRHVRRLQTVLDAATLALLVPIAAEVTATAGATAFAAFASLCGAAALWLPVFPYYRTAPVLLAVLGMLRYARTQRSTWLILAYGGAGAGLLWSLDTGTYAVAGIVITTLLLGIPLRRLAIPVVVAVILPLVILLLVRADIRQFFVDSFVILPRSIDAVWALPAPAPFTAAGLRYFFPPVLYGCLLALAVRNRDVAPRLVIIAVFSLFLFRTAAGRVSWSHTRFAVPLLGIALVAFILEPLVVARRRMAAALLALPLLFYLEVPQNLAAGAKLLAGWRARQRHEGMVPYPMAPGRGIYTTAQNAADLAALQAAVGALGPGTLLDFSNERALYYLLQRKAPVRCVEISMLSVPALFSEAMAQLIADPPVAVIVKGDPAIAGYDGITNRDRVPELARWIDTNYPNRQQIGRFTLATR